MFRLVSALFTACSRNKSNVSLSVSLCIASTLCLMVFYHNAVPNRRSSGQKGAFQEQRPHHLPLKTNGGMVGHSYSPHAFLQSSVSCAHPHYDALSSRSCSPVLTFHHLFLHSHGCSETDEHTRFSLLYSFRAVIVYVCVLRTGPSGMVCLCVNI